MSEFLTGLAILVCGAIMLAIPGLVSAAFWGWDTFVVAPVLFWAGLLFLALFVMLCQAIGDPDD